MAQIRIIFKGHFIQIFEYSNIRVHHWGGALWAIYELDHMVKKTFYQASRKYLLIERVNKLEEKKCIKVFIKPRLIL